MIYYDPALPAAQPVAESVNSVMGGGAAAPLPGGTPPVADGTINGAGVLVMLGLDKSNKTLEDLDPRQPSPVVVTNPTPSSSLPTT